MADTPKTPAELAEQLLQAMKIVSDSSLNQISFDKTEICTILGKENESANNNCYFVTNGSMRFKAYVPQSIDGKQVKYKKDDSVRVSIPNGDYTKKKIIEGLSVDEDNDNPTIFVSPLETMLEITDSIVPETEAGQTYGLTANGSVEQICLWSADFDGDKKYRDIQNSDICDSIALKADFKTVFANSNVIKGHYGLRLDLYFHTADNDGDEFYNVNQHSVYLDSANMFGNPYSFLIYSTQAIKFSIKDFGILKGANLYFYQKKDFERLNDKGIKETVPSNVLDNNLLVKNLYLSFGSDIIDIDDNIFKIFCNDKLTYNDDNNVTTESIDDYKELGLLWYNKDEDGKYVGFNDGIYDEDYDEIKYIKESSADARLLAQKGRDCPYDEAGLTLAANLQDEKQLYSELYNLINKDLYNELVAFKSRMQTLVDIEEGARKAFDILLISDKENEEINSISEFLADFKARQDIVVEQYTEILKFAKQWQNAKLLGEEKPEKSDKIKPDLITNASGNKECVDINGYIADYVFSWAQCIRTDNLNGRNNIFKALNEFIAPNKNYQSYASVYDSFKYRMESIYKKIFNASLKIEQMVNNKTPGQEGSTDVPLLNAYLTDGDYEFNEYASTADQEAFKKDNDNRYCIYWFRYQPNAAELDEEPRVTDKKWKRITNNEKVNGRNITNLGLPQLSFPKEGDSENKYYDKRDTDAILGINLDTTLKTEKIKAILYYNHTKYESNVIEFTNSNPYTEQNAADQNGALYIEHSENSKGSYQSYGVNNCLANASDAHTKRQLKVRFDGEQGKDEYLNDAQVFWYIPRNSTMLTYDLDDYSTDFTNDTIDSTERLIVSTSGIDSEKHTLITNSKWTEDNGIEWKDENGVSWRFEEITNDSKTLYFTRGSNNLGSYTLVKLPTELTYNYKDDSTDKELKLTCTSEWQMIDKPDTSIEGYYCFYRTINENEDSRLFPYHIKDYYSPSFSQNEIICKVMPKGSNVSIFEANMVFTFSSYGTSGTDYTLVVAPTGTRAAVEPNYTDDLGNHLVLQAKLYDYKNEEVKITDENQSTQIRCEWVTNEKIHPYEECIVVGDLIYIKIAKDATSGEYDTEDAQYYGVLKTSIDVSIAPQEEENTEEKEDTKKESTYPSPIENKNNRTVTLTTFTTIPCMYGNYFIEGPSIVVYDSTGTNPSYYKNPFKIFNATTKQELKDGIEWSIFYYRKDTGLVLKDTDTDYKSFETSLKFMPTLGNNNELILCNMFIGGDIDLYPIVICKYYGNIIWGQPIYLMQNRYPSAMINAWDGSFQIDKENGTIMSTMLGAGRKNAKNQFEGILIGDVEVAGAAEVPNLAYDNGSGIGMYGINEGAQSFYFGINGTAFLGKAGSGRIVFNGSKGTIKSAGYDTGKGMLIDLDDNFIDAKGNFILTAGTKDSNNYLGLASGGELNYSIPATINTYYRDDWRIVAGKTFAVDGSGFFTASNADITGKITATEINTQKGTIGDFTLENGALFTNSRKTLKEMRYAGVHLSNDGISVVATGGLSYFIADTQSNLLEFTGKIIAGSGEIAGWEIESDYLGFFTTSGDGTNEFFLSRKGKKLWVPVAGKEMTCLCDFGGKFAIDTTGSLYASNANISGIINATKGGHIGKWYIDSSGNLKSESGLVTLNGITGEIKGSSISGSSITGSSITSTGTNKAFTLDKAGKCIIKYGEIQDYLHINGYVYIGSKSPSDYNITEQKEQLFIDGSVILNGENRNIYLSSKGSKGAQINALGQEQLVLAGMTSVFLKGYGYKHGTTSLENGIGISLKSQSSIKLQSGVNLDDISAANGTIYLESSENILLSAVKNIYLDTDKHISIGQTTYSADFKLTLPPADEICLSTSEGAISFVQYIKNLIASGT